MFCQQIFKQVAFHILIHSSARIQISYIPQEKSLQIHLRCCISAAKQVEGVGTDEMEVIDVDGSERDIEGEEGEEVVESDSLAT